MGNGNKCCKPWWPPIVIGCVPFGGYGGYYGGYYPVYTQTIILPATTSVVAGPIVPVTAVASAGKASAGSSWLDADAERREPRQQDSDHSAD